MSDAHGAGRAQGRVGSVLNGKWRIDARIGSGGMATVYAATNRKGQRAAVKMLHTQLSRDPATKARFLREAYVANTIAHPGVVRVENDDIAEDGSVYLVLELLEGETIEARRLQAGGKLGLDEAMDYADQALDALAAAHDKGIIHRDVKPDNVFVTKDGRVKLLDFGLAQIKSAELEATRTGVTIGTPEFMPPEQALGRRDAIDARSDVWGLGATLFQVLSGQYVHDKSTLHEQLLASATQRARPVQSVAPNVPSAIAKVIDKALELDQNDRWSSARAMQRAMRSARGGKRASVRVDEEESITVPAAVAEQELAGLSVKVPSSDKTMQLTPPPASSGKTLPNSARTLKDAVPRDVTFQMSTAPAPPISVAPPTPAPVTARLPVQQQHQKQLQMQHQQRPGEGSSPGRQVTLPHNFAPTPVGGVHAVQGNMPFAGTPSGGIPQLNLGATGGHPMLSQSGGNPILSQSGGHPMLSQSGANPMLSQSGANPIVPLPTEPPKPRQSRALLVVTIVFLLLAAALGGWVYLRNRGFTFGG